MMHDDVPVDNSPEGQRFLAAVFCRDPVYQHAKAEIDKILTLQAELSAVDSLSEERQDEISDQLFRANGWMGVLSILSETANNLLLEITAEQAIVAKQLSLFATSDATGEKVYFQSDGEFIKIGRTIRSEHKRRKENQTGNPRLLTTLAVIPRTSEKKLAARFHQDHVRGEWYRMSDDLMAFITAWQLVEGVLNDPR